MHELLLHGSIPTTRHSQVLSILAGIAAMQPQPFHERHLIYKPTRPVGRATTQVGGTQAVQTKQSNPMQAVQGAMQGDLFYLHLVEDLVGKRNNEGNETLTEKEAEVSERKEEQVDGGEGGGIGGDQQTSTTTENADLHTPKTATQCTLRFRDIPEAGSRRPVTSRLVADIPISSGDTAAFMSAMEYTHISTHHLFGHRLTHSSVSILLFQPMLPPTPSSSSPSSSASSSTIRTDQALDPHTYILQLSVRVSDGTKPVPMERGVKELMSMKEMLKGVVDVDVVERGCLDMRVR